MLMTFLPTGIYSADVTYTGMTNGNGIIKNASFTDISGNINTDNILRMAVYSTINEYGNTRYRPNDFAMKQDVLADLVRVIGKQDEAVAAGEALKLLNPNLSSVEAYLGGHIEIAKSAGIITAQEIDAMAVLTKAEIASIENQAAAIAKKSWKTTKLERDNLVIAMKKQRSNDKALKTAATREQTAVWTAKALGLEPVKSEKTMEIHSYKDWKAIATASIPYLEAVHRSGIIKGETTVNYMPKGRIKRGDLATMLSKAANSSLAALELTIGYGKVTSRLTTKDINPYSQKTNTDIAILTPNGETLNIKALQSQSVPVIKGGRVGNESLIQNNDIVEYTLTKDNKVLLLQVGKQKELKGKFISYNTVLGLVNMTDINGKAYQFKLQPNTVTTAQKVPININNTVGNTPAMAIYEGNILKSLDLDVSSDKLNNKEIAIKILFADSLGGVLKVEDDNQNRQYYQLTENAEIYINDEQQGIEAIGFNQEAILKVADNRVTEVRIYTENSIEEEPYVQIITGRVREVVGNNLFISPDGDTEAQNSYILGNNVPIIRNKQNVNKYKLQPGDRIKIYVDSTMGDYVSRIEIQGSGVKITNLYRGDIKDVLPATGEVLLSNVYTYGYFDWVKQGDYIKYKLSDDAEIYSGNSLLDLSKLKDSIGKTIYAVSKDNYGREEIVQGLLKDGYEDSTYKKIQGVKYTANQLTLSDGRIIDYLKGSIIIKDGKLMDASDLKINTAAFVIQNKGAAGTTKASIISLDSFTGLGGYNISKGYLNALGEDYFTIESGFRLANNSWESYKGFNFQLNNDTYIYDNIIKNSVISSDKFAESRLKPYTYTWTNYASAGYSKELHEEDIYHSDYKNYRYHTNFHEHSLLYTVTDEYGNAVGINIFAKDKDQFKPDKVHTERITSGQVEKLDNVNKVITINKIMEFSSIYNEWKPTTVSVPLNTSKAIILKSGKLVSLDDLTTENRIYAISISGSAIIILAE